MTAWGPDRWWRVLDANGDLWCETSDEQEAREALLTAPGPARLERLYVRTEYRWQTA